MEAAAAREDETGQLEQEHGCRHEEHRIDELDQPQRLAEPDLLAEPDRGGGDGVEARRRVVLADAVGEAVAVEDRLGVGDVVDRVVAERPAGTSACSRRR